MNKLRFWMSIVVALLGPFQFGLGLAIVNTMLDALSQEMNFDKNIGGAVVSAVIYFGCAMGSFLSGWVQSLFQRCSQVLVAALFLLGSLLCAFSTSQKLCWSGLLPGCVPTMLLIGRWVVGVASGITVVISPKYLTEVSIPNLRMSLCTVLEICIVFGVLFGFMIGLPYEFDSFDDEYPWWRVMFLTGSLPAVLQIILQIYTLLTPSGLDPVSVSRLELVQVESPSMETTPRKTPLRELFLKKYRKSVVLGLGVPVVCQSSGINVLGAYSTIVFEDAGFSRPIIGSILFGVVNLVCTVITAFLIEHYRRRQIAFFSFLGMGVCFVGVAFAELTKPQMRGVLSVAFVLLYVAFFSAGCGPLTTGYAPEVVPPNIAGTVLGVGQSLCRLTDLILVLVFPEMLDTLGALPTFLIFAAFAFLSYFFLKTFMIETKGRELRDIFDEIVTE